MKLLGSPSRNFACWVVLTLAAPSLGAAQSGGDLDREAGWQPRASIAEQPSTQPEAVAGNAQERPGAIASPQSQRDAYLAHGRELEDARMWADAIQHYDKATAEFPGDAKLYQRLIVARLHHDVIRRMGDRSYLASVRDLTRSQALDLYSEILANLAAHYVDDIQWSRVQLFGTASLEVALTEEDFVKRMLPNVSAEKAFEFSRSIHGRLANRSTKTRFDLRANAAVAAEMAQQELGLSQTATILEFLSGAVATLDTYTRLLSPDQLNDMFSDINGNFVGLGVELKPRDAELEILSVIPGGPAEQVGLREGQLIVAVDGVTGQKAGANHIADLLRGPEYTKIQLSIRDLDGQTRELQATRRRVDVPCVRDSKIVDAQNGIGYLRLTNFQKSTPRDVDAALWKLHRSNMQALIIDLRGNPGGLLSAAVDLADRFIRDGRIVSTRGRNPRENFDFIAHARNTWDVPLAVLIDGDSASASEVFAGAIADHQRGKIVGQKSYGKGSVQGVFTMQSADFGLCLTTAKFYSPSGREINRKGVEPSILVSEPIQAARVDLAGSLPKPNDNADSDSTLKAAIRSLIGPAMISQK